MGSPELDSYSAMISAMILSASDVFWIRTMAKKIAFSPTSIDSLTSGRLKDPLTPGLSLEKMSSGKKRWLYRRPVAGKKVVATLFGGLYPATPIAEAREWARPLNEMVEIGLDPLEVERERKAREDMTVAQTHALYMNAVREGRWTKANNPENYGTII